MDKKIFIFGAGKGGDNYYNRSVENIEVLGFLDNDPNKQGMLINGIVVYSPKILEEIDQNKFDYIVITSMYIESIIEQLEMLGIKKEKMKFPPKSYLKKDKKPFENPIMRKKASDLLCNLNNILKNDNCYISFGTLLGIVRENQILPWDDDIDISIFPKDVDFILEKLISNVDKLSTDFNFKIYKRKYSEIKVANISMHCFYEGEDLFHISFACLNDSETNPDMYYQELNITPKKFFEGYDEITFNDSNLKVPKGYKEYLEYTYGDWMVTKKNTSFYDNALSYKETERVKELVLYYDFNEK